MPCDDFGLVFDELLEVDKKCTSWNFEGVFECEHGDSNSFCVCWLEFWFEEVKSMELSLAGPGLDFCGIGFSFRIIC